MRGGLDETLARMARREELLRRRSEESAGGQSETLDGPDGPDEYHPEPVGAAGGQDKAANRPAGTASRQVGATSPQVGATSPQVGATSPQVGALATVRATDTVDADPVGEVVEAVRRVVATYPGLSVAVRVEHDGQAYPIRIAWVDGSATVTIDPTPTPPPVWPMSVKTVPGWVSADSGLAQDPAARLAEMIRRNPSLLDRGRQPG